MHGAASVRGALAASLASPFGRFLEQTVLQLTGNIDDCCCSIEDVDRLNNAMLPLIKRITETNFFKFYKVRLHGKAEALRGSNCND